MFDATKLLIGLIARPDRRGVYNRRKNPSIAALHARFLTGLEAGQRFHMIVDADPRLISDEVVQRGFRLRRQRLDH